jgi:hypothetical protein
MNFPRASCNLRKANRVDMRPLRMPSEPTSHELISLAQKLHAPLAALCDQLHRVKHFMRRMLRPGTA